MSDRLKTTDAKHKIQQTIFPIAPSPQFRLVAEGPGKVTMLYPKGSRIFSQGDLASHVYFIRDGSVKLSAFTAEGKEATLALLHTNDFLGEECISGENKLRSTSAIAGRNSLLVRIKKSNMVQSLRDHPDFMMEFFLYLLEKTSGMQENLTNLLCHRSEQRLARTLILLAEATDSAASETLLPEISQEDLAAMVGCTRSRANRLLNQFRKKGLIDYGHRITINKKLLQSVLKSVPSRAVNSHALIAGGKLIWE
ncbi:Crp/Fnr family transcriptional regulator [Granulicella tundricola]|nr:Crp/Fnr family transcriptional regulator [Granulicella tundricola]